MAIDLYWLPLGAGGHLVRFNGRVYEAIRARKEARKPLELYHTALKVSVPEGRFVIENAWPIPDGNGADRGVAVDGPVGHPRLGRLRVFRYEIRCWRDGVIPDETFAVASPHRLSDDVTRARHLLELVGTVPAFVWGRDVLGIGDMWNSNSTIAWLLERAGLDAAAIEPPAGGRVPGWTSGVRVAEAGWSSPPRVPV